MTLEWIVIPAIAYVCLFYTLLFTWIGGRRQSRFPYLFALLAPAVCLLVLLFLQHTQSFLALRLAPIYGAAPKRFSSAQEVLSFYRHPDEWGVVLQQFFPSLNNAQSQFWVSSWYSQANFFAQLLFVLDYAAWLWFPVLLLFIIYFLYIWQGERGAHYQRWVRPRRSTWLVFGLILLLGIVGSILPLTRPNPLLLTATPAMVLIFAAILVDAGVQRSLLRYLLAGVFAGVWLVLPSLLPNVYIENVRWRAIFYTLRDSTDSWFWLPLTLILMVYLVYVWRGCVRKVLTLAEPQELQHYRELIAPRRSLWTVFGVVVWAIVIFVNSSLEMVNGQISGLRAIHDNLLDGIRDVRTVANQLLTATSDEPTADSLTEFNLRRYQLNLEVNAVSDRISDLQQLLPTTAAPVSSSSTPTPTWSTVGLIVSLHEDEILDKLAQLSRALNRQTDRFEIELGQNSAPLRRLTELEKEIQELEAQLAITTTNTITYESRLKERRNLIGELRLPMGHIRAHAEEVVDLTRAMEATVTVLNRNRSIAFTVVSILFGLFLLLPWLLYFSFLISKRSTVTRNRRTLLEDLGLLRHFLDDSVAIVDDQEQRLTQLASKIDHAWQTAKQLYNSGPNLALAETPIPLATDTVTLIHRVDEDTSLHAVLSELHQLVQDYRNITPLAIPARRLYLVRNEIIETVITYRRFHSREYIIPLVMLTLLTGIGWYYTYFPNSIAGLAQLIVNGATIQELTKYLTTDFTAFTMTFAGGWLYATTMLMNRWAQDDLLPRSYLYAAMRLTIALLVGLVFAVTTPFGNAEERGTLPAVTSIAATLTQTETDLAGVIRTAVLTTTLPISPTQTTNTPADGRPSPAAQELIRITMLLLAFAVGAAPYEFVRALFRSIQQPVQGIGAMFRQVWPWGQFHPPDWDSKYPLSELEDLSIWDDTRLEQEGIQNVHGLATTDLERLVLNVPFPAQQLIDWVDQALLYVHTRDLWRPGFAAIGIRTATDLLDAQKSGVDLVAAFNHGQTATQSATTRPATPLTIDENIIQSILAAMQRNPNIDYVHQFWGQRKQQATAPGAIGAQG